MRAWSQVSSGHNLKGKRDKLAVLYPTDLELA